MSEKTEKERRHEVASRLRSEITTSGRRALVIKNLATKENYDDSDKLRISILFSKVSFVQGCENEYMQLIIHLYNNPELKPQAKAFHKRWNG